MLNSFSQKFKQEFDDTIYDFEDLSLGLPNDIYGYKVDGYFITISKQDYLKMLNQDKDKVLREIEEMMNFIDNHAQMLQAQTRRAQIINEMRKFGDYGNSFKCPSTRRIIQESQMHSLNDAYSVFIAVADILKIKNDDLKEFKEENPYKYEELKEKGNKNLKNFLKMDYFNRSFLKEKLNIDSKIANEIVNKYLQKKPMPIIFSDKIAYDMKIGKELSKQEAETNRIAEEQDQLNLDRGIALSLEEWELFEEPKSKEKQIKEDEELARKLQEEEIRKARNRR